MANEKPPQPSQGLPGQSDDLLSAFLASVRDFTKTITVDILAAVPTGSDRVIMASSAQTFTENWDNMLDSVAAAAARLTPAQHGGINAFLHAQNANAIPQRTASVAASVLASSGGEGGQVTLGFFDWLQHNHQLVKKIILAILKAVFGTLPDWVTSITEILDEILDLILSLLGGALGFPVHQVASNLSEGNRRYMGEMTELAKWQAALSSTKPIEQDT